MLAIAGRRGWLYEGVFRAIEEYDVGGAVRFLEYVPDADLAALYSTADVLAMPSAYEGFGIPVIEAMACGTPVICSDGGALPEVAGAAALVVPVGNIDQLAEALVGVTSDADAPRADARTGAEPRISISLGTCGAAASRGLSSCWEQRKALVA